MFTTCEYIVVSLDAFCLSPVMVEKMPFRVLVTP